jgi:hypothetical protein
MVQKAIGPDLLGSDPGTVRVSRAEATEEEQKLEAGAFYSQRAQLPSLCRYMEGIIHLFYQQDDIMRGHPELQVWCQEMTKVVLCQAQDRGKIIPDWSSRHLFL